MLKNFSAKKVLIISVKILLLKNSKKIVLKILVLKIQTICVKKNGVKHTKNQG